MPTYEYRCKQCGHELEAHQAFTDDPLTECPSCGGALKKKFGSVGISFKGSGFYKNDSRTSSSSTSSTSSAGSSGTNGGDAGSSESTGASSSSSSSSSDSGSTTTPTTTAAASA